MSAMWAESPESGLGGESPVWAGSLQYLVELSGLALSSFKAPRGCLHSVAVERGDVVEN
mgnify:CR=1 FL=1